MLQGKGSCIYGWFVGAALVMMLVSGGDGVAQEKGRTNTEAARVNGAVISRDELDAALKRVENQMAAMGHPASAEQMSEVRTRVLDSLIDRELLYQDSRKQGIKMDQSEIDEQMKALQARFPSEQEYQAALKKLNLNEQDLRTQFEREISIERLVDQQVSSKITVPDSEVKAFYDANPELFKTPEMVRAGHILVKVEPTATDADKAKARRKIEQISTRIKKGEDFAAVAKETSDCPSGARGGDLDFFQRGQMVGPFDAAAFALKKGEMSGVVETQFGFHLIQVTDKKPSSVVSLEESKEKIGQHLKQEKTNQEVSRYVSKLRSGADIQVSAH